MTTQPKTVTLHLVSALYGRPELMMRTRLYIEKNKTLVADEVNDEPDAPYGLRVLQKAHLPKLGGLTGMTAVGYTKEAAVRCLLAELEKRTQKAQREAEHGVSTIALLKKELP